MKDFTLDIYRHLLETALANGYHLTRFEDYISQPDLHQKVFVLRHDVDKLPLNSLATAQLQADLGVKGTYYFRVVKESYHPAVIEQIAALGHEIGYHYEDMALCQGNAEKAIAHFKEWLEKFRIFYPVSTICMHGSPLSKFDNRSLWEHYNYKDYGLKAEPYFDVDFSKVLYVTDTGRRWDGAKVAVRDKIQEGLSHPYRSTTDLINAFRENKMPDQILQNIHPQRWTDSNMQWWKERLLQNTKNMVKKAFFVKRTA